MPSGWEQAGPWVGGPLSWLGAPWPFTLRTVLCDLRPRFLPKGTVGAGCRAVARNGRVLLCGDRPLAELAGRVARVRLQTWHRAILPGDRPQPYGVLLCVRTESDPAGPAFRTRLVRAAERQGHLELEVGGGLVLEFRVPPAG